ncbi:unnamed protein product, partial [Didymodactylos carnosus]
TRFLDLSHNDITNLNEFQNLKLPHLEHLNLSLNKLDDIDELKYLKSFHSLSNLHLKENSIQQSLKSDTNLISFLNISVAFVWTLYFSAVRQILPQLKYLDDNELSAIIHFATDINIIQLPESKPYYVPDHLKTSFDGILSLIQEYYRLFDTRSREDLHSCYHEKCIFSLCISRPSYDCGIQTCQYTYGQQICDSRNLKCNDDISIRSIKSSKYARHMELLKFGKQAVLDYLRIKFPATKHDLSSFHVDIISSSVKTQFFFFEVQS